jgi:hypothetical protein
MSGVTENKDEKMTTLEFCSSHRPRLVTGCYKIVIEQAAEGKGDKLFKKTFEKSFSVASDRFHINPADIHSVFPPNLSIADHNNVLPHIVLKRPTIPWERYSIKSEPWLILLLLTDKENKSCERSIINLGELKKSPGFLDLQLEKGQKDDDKVNVLNIKKALLVQIMPAAEGLKYLCHVRKFKENDNKEQAVIISNRVTKSGENYNAYLVSIEEFNFQQLKGKDCKVEDYVRLVLLKSWTFICSKRYKVTKQHLANLNGNINESLLGKLRTLIGQEFFTEKSFRNELEKQEICLEDKDIGIFAFGEFEDIIKHLDHDPSFLRLPKTPTCSDAVEKYLKRGFVPLPHFLNSGNKTVSWYHGPLITYNEERELETVFTSIGESGIEHAEQLLIYYSKDKMFDVGYSSAWELGRLLTLQNSRLSVELYQFKKLHEQSIKAHEQSLLHMHLPGCSAYKKNDQIPEMIQKWFNDLRILKYVPFNYLVPDEKMLPQESIRFFYVDHMWIDSLISGAYSIGRISSLDTANALVGEEQKHSITGIFIRSEVVSGWPDLLVDAQDCSKALACLRKEKLSDSVLICLFAGTIETVSIHLAPEALHSELNDEVKKVISIDKSHVITLKKDHPEEDSASLALKLLKQGKGCSFSLKSKKP